jgi:hypothetical protein
MSFRCGMNGIRVGLFVGLPLHWERPFIIWKRQYDEAKGMLRGSKVNEIIK